MSHAAGSRPPEQEALAGEIERTREELGETVEALAAKADVKGRAQRRAAKVRDDMRGKARAVTGTMAKQARELRDEAAAKAARAGNAAQGASAPVASRAATAGRAVRDATPAPVQRSVGQAVLIVRGHRRQAAATAAAAAALILAWLAVRRRRH
jgi:hypothetical protein